MDDFIFTLFCCIFVFIIAFCWGFSISDNFSYKQGQIDAINGIIKYELVLQPNHEKIWIEKDDIEE